MGKPLPPTPTGARPAPANSIPGGGTSPTERPAALTPRQAAALAVATGLIAAGSAKPGVYMDSPVASGLSVENLRERAYLIGDALLREP
jgi:hypothetical protein